MSSNSNTFEYTTATDHNLLCPICRSPFVDPWMSVTCEHFYCHTCILQHLSTSSTCPCDRTALDVEANQLVPAPRLVKLLCDELPVTCTACETWSGQRSDWQRHARVECKKLAPSDSDHHVCKKACEFQAKSLEDLQKHEEEGCDLPASACELCEEYVSRKDMPEHLSYCLSAPADCSHCGLSNLTRSSLPLHVDNDCPDYMISCPHSRYGCSATGSRRSISQDHLALDCHYEPLKVYLRSTQDRITTLEQENTELKEGLSGLTTKYRDLRRRVDRLVTRVGGDEEPSSPSTSVSDNLAALSAQMAEYARVQTESQRGSERINHDLRGEINSLQMVIHDLRGEMMALQQAQYYENASRFYSRSANTETGPAAKESKEGSASTSSSSSSILSPSMNALSIPGQALYPFPPNFNPSLAANAYPFPPPGYLHPGQPFYPTSPNGMMQPPIGRRFYGWPYAMYGGGTSPDGGPKL